MHPRRARLLALATVTGIAPGLAHAANSTATPAASPAGVTPRFLGFNNGHFRSTSNTSAWVDYAGINAMRVWAATSDYVSATEPPSYGDHVFTQSDFDAARASF